MAKRSSAKKVDLGRDYIRSILHYDPLTGVFTWRKPVCHRKARAGAFDASKGYRYLTIDQARYQEHKIAWLFINGILPDRPIDHINGKRDDNGIENLRPASTSTNNQNSTRPVNSTGC